MAKESGFDKDFGYLIPFLDRVAQAGNALSPEARAELQRLMTGEKEKWQRIRDVLAGAPVTSGAPPGRGPAPRTGSQPPRAATAPELPATLTVGSLRRG